MPVVTTGTPRTPGHHAEPDVDAHEADHGRWARHLDNRRRFRRRLAAGLAAAGVAAIVVGLSWGAGNGDGDGTKAQPVEVKEGSVTADTAKPPTSGPGGVGENPEKTGLPTQNPDGGRVRTGTKEQGCFANMREYLDAWHRTETEPDPCFLSQEPPDQRQPDGVVRSYNGEKF